MTRPAVRDVRDWRDLTPAEVLESYEVLTLEMVAYVLSLVYTRGVPRGQPNPKAVRPLIAAGKLRLLDPTQTPRYQTITAAVVRHYRDTGEALPRRVPVSPLRGVS